MFPLFPDDLQKIRDYESCCWLSCMTKFVLLLLLLLSPGARCRKLLCISGSQSGIWLLQSEESDGVSLASFRSAAEQIQVWCRRAFRHWSASQERHTARLQLVQVQQSWDSRDHKPSNLPIKSRSQPDELYDRNGGDKELFFQVYWSEHLSFQSTIFTNPTTNEIYKKMFTIEVREKNPMVKY